MTDFISQSAIDEGVDFPTDALGHEQCARQLVEKITLLRPGAVIGLQGSWGRGKTDVLARTASLLKARRDTTKNKIADWIWLNPWQYGSPDLLSPMVLALLERIPLQERSTGPALKQAAQTVIRAGLEFGLKAAAVTVPGGVLLGAAATGVDKLLESFFRAKEIDDKAHAESIPDPDPSARMAERFSDLVEACVKASDSEADRLVILVDDLDRCLPDRQVALLEAIRFLTSTGAKATFVLAIDPTLSRQAIIAHYGTAAFDPDRYLDKMYHLRLTLPAVAPIELRQLCQMHLSQKVLVEGQRPQLREALKSVFGDSAEKFEHRATDALTVPDLKNPRIVGRMFDRLRILVAQHKHRVIAQGDAEVVIAIVWLGIFERWPAIREVMQDAGEGGYKHRYNALRGYYKGTSNTDIAIVRRLPKADEVPELNELFSRMTPSDAHKSNPADLIGKLFHNVDVALRGVGL